MMRKCVIGLTGGIASGKSSVVKVLEEHGVVSINADNIGHQVYLPNQPAYNKVN
jgi:dephospho-CoA kinase